MKIIPDVPLARHLARAAAYFSLEGGPPPIQLDAAGLAGRARAPSGEWVPFSEELRQDVEALAACNLVLAQHFSVGPDALVARFTAHDALVVLRRLASPERDGLTADGRLIGLADDGSLNLRDPHERTLAALHAHFGRGELVAINRRLRSIAYRIPGVGVRRRPYSIQGQHVSMGRHTAPIERFAHLDELALA